VNLLWRGLVAMYDVHLGLIRKQVMDFILVLIKLFSLGVTVEALLLTRLSSWFGIQGSALDWFKSYLSSRSFRVKCNNNFSSCHTCICGVPQGSDLGPLLFILYTTPLSTLFRHFLWTTTFMPTTHNFSSLSIHQFLTPASLTSTILSRRYLLGWLLIF